MSLGFPTLFRHAPQIQRGFTLIETMVVVAIVAVLASLAAPSFTALIQRYRIDSAHDSLLNAIQLARTEAIRMGQRVNLEQTVCALNDWGCGWIMYADTNNDGTQDAAEPTIRQFDPPDNVRIVNTNATPLTRLSIARTGQFVAGGGNTAFNIGPRGTSADSCKALVINLTMRLRTDTGVGFCPP